MNKKTVTLYRVYREWMDRIPTMGEAEAVETPKLYKLKNNNLPAFRYASQIPKEEACLTPEDAIARYFSKLERNIKTAEENLTALKQERVAAFEVFGTAPQSSKNPSPRPSEASGVSQEPKL